MPSIRCAAFFSCVALAAIGLSLYAQELTLPLKPDSVRFAVIGDMGTGEKPQYEVAEQMIAYRQKFPFEFVITLGDDLYRRERPERLRKQVRAALQAFARCGRKFLRGARQPRQPQRAVL